MVVRFSQHLCCIMIIAVGVNVFGASAGAKAEAVLCFPPFAAGCVEGGYIA